MRLPGRDADRIGSQDKPILFVVGSGRSGTTLLYEILCSDPTATWVSNYSQRAAKLAGLHPHGPTAFKGSGSRLAVRPVEGYRLFDRIRPPSTDGRGDAVLSGEDLSDAERLALKRAVDHHLSRRGAWYFVNKNTRNTRRVGYLTAAFPDARVAHVVRHPVAAVGSMLAVPFFDEVRVWWLGGARVADLVSGGLDRTLLAAEVWAREVAACDLALSHMPVGNWTTVYYEELVEDPGPVLSSILSLVGRPWTPTLKRQVEERSLSNRNRTTMSRLTADQQEAIWTVVSEPATRHGYVLGRPDRCAV